MLWTPKDVSSGKVLREWRKCIYASFVEEVSVLAMIMGKVEYKAIKISLLSIISLLYNLLKYNIFMWYY